MAILKVKFRHCVTKAETDKSLVMLKMTIRSFNGSSYIDLENGHVVDDVISFNVSPTMPINEIGQIIAELETALPSVIRDVWLG